MTAGVVPDFGWDGGICTVQREGRNCSRITFCASLCFNHYIRVLTLAKRGLTEAEWRSRLIPYDRREFCLVTGCDRDDYQEGLCANHLSKWRASSSSKPRYLSRAVPQKLSGTFSLYSLEPVARLELLVALQSYDRLMGQIEPTTVQLVIHRLRGETTLVDPNIISRFTASVRKQSTAASHFGVLHRSLISLQYRHFGSDPQKDDVWDTSLLGFDTPERTGRLHGPSSRGAHPNRKPLNFGGITVPWLKRAVKDTLLAAKPDTVSAQRHILAAEKLATALSMGPHTGSAASLTSEDAKRAFRLIDGWVDGNGKLYSPGHRSKLLSSLRELVEMLRASGKLPGAAPGFAITYDFKISKRHGGPSATPDEDRAPRVPVPHGVVAAIYNSIGLIEHAIGTVNTGWTTESKSRMIQTALRALIDTGRRPNEILLLQPGCVVRHESREDSSEDRLISQLYDEPPAFDLLYANTKTGDGAKVALPISAEVAAYLVEWEEYRTRLPLPSRLDPYLFPATGYLAPDQHGAVSTSVVNAVLQNLLEAIPDLRSASHCDDEVGSEKYREKIILYTFRHAYVQRLIDSGADITLVRDLMGHDSFDTTAGYYQLDVRARRQAIAAVAPMSVDYLGHRLSMPAGGHYEVSRVTTSIGGCSHSEMVRADGKLCPRGRRCGSCPFFTTDVSFLPALRANVVAFRSTLATIESHPDIRPSTIVMLREDIEDYERIISSLERWLSELPPDDRARIEAAMSTLSPGRDAGTQSPRAGGLL